jgi:hypothetical protein
MNFPSFKELLLRKTDDESLKTLIKVVDTNFLADQIIESLEKMAVRKGAGSHANLAIRHLGTEMDPELEPAMIREALGHHASRYRAALASGENKMANDHAAQFFKIMDLVHHLQPHSHGKLQAEMVDVKPWERTHASRSETFADRIARDPEYAKDNPVSRGKKKPHQFVNDTVGFSFVPKGNDWSFLQNDPHAAYGDETSRHGHVGAYPMEHTKINGKFIPIEDVENINDGNKSHPFDSHPIFSHHGESIKNRTPERDAQYVKEHEEYMSSPHVETHLAHQENLMSSGAHESRGLKVGQPVHAGSKRLEQQKQEAQSAPAEAAAPAPSAVKQDQPKVITRKMSDKDKAKAMLPPHLHDLLKD